MAAIQNNSSDIVIPMDGDGQNDPAGIWRLLKKFTEGFDVASGWRAAREDNALTRRLSSVIANWLISTLLPCGCVGTPLTLTQPYSARTVECPTNAR
jgi:hypothetical protein